MLALVSSMVLVVGVPTTSWRSSPDDYWWSTGRDRFGQYVRLEVDALATPRLFPTPMYGGQLGISFGRRWAHARVGVLAAGNEAFRLLPESRVGVIMETTDLEVCTAGRWYRHMARLCGGTQAGVLHLRWENFDEPGAREMPWVAFVAGGQYALALGAHADVHAGIGLVAPLLVPRIGARTSVGVVRYRAANVAPTFSVGFGLRLH